MDDQAIRNEIITNGMMNLFSGVGAQNHQPAYNAIQTNSYSLLSWYEIENLYTSGSWLHRSAVDLKPSYEVFLPIDRFSEKFIDVLDEFNLAQLIKELRVTSLLYGGALLWFSGDQFYVIEAPRARPDNALKPEKYLLYDGAYTSVAIREVSEANELALEDVYKMDGLWLPPRLRHANQGYGDSIYSKVHEPILNFLHAIASVNQAMARHSVLTYGIEGLAGLIFGGQKAQVRELIAETVNTVGTHNALVYDSEVAQAQFISQNLTNLDNLVQVAFDQCSAAIGVPSAVLWGAPKSGSGGLSNGVEGDITAMSVLTKNAHLEIWGPALQWCCDKVGANINVGYELMLAYLPEQTQETNGLEPNNETV